MHTYDVVLVHPDMPYSTDARMDFPLGLGYIAAVLEEKGHTVAIADLSDISEDAWPQSIPKAHIYGIMVYTCAYDISLRLQQFLKRRDPECIVVVGGAHPTALSEDTVVDFDAVVAGEGEIAFLSLIAAWKRGENIRRIWSAAPISNLDALPFPARHLVDYQAYHRKVEGVRCATMLTSRGCPFHCAFCCKTLGPKIRIRTRKSIISEASHIIQKYGVKTFTFMDDLFSFRKDFYALLADIKDLDITFRCHCRAGLNRSKDFEKLYASGCRVVAFGIESGSQKLLDVLQKGTTVQQNTQAILKAKRAGLLTKAFLITGIPGETQEDIEATKRWFQEAQPDQFTLLQLIPLPGSQIFKFPAKYGIKNLSKDWSQYFTRAGSYEGGVTFEVEGQTAEEMLDLRQDLLRFLNSMPWGGEMEDYQLLREENKL